MTPAKLEAIRQADAEDDPRGGIQARIDRRALLAYVDTLERLNEGLRTVAGNSFRAHARTRRAAAHLLAHQQARGIEAREEEEQGIKDYLDLRDRADILAVEVATLRKQLEEREADMHRRIRAGYDRTIADSWRAELARKDAEIERLTAELDRLRHENGDCGEGCTIAPCRAALGDEPEGGAA